MKRKRLCVIMAVVGCLLVLLMCTAPQVVCAQARTSKTVAAANLLADPGSLVVKNTKNGTGMWDLPLLDYISGTELGGPVHNYVKYIANDEVNGWRLAFCMELNDHFIDSTEYIGREWKANGLYSEISYAIANGSNKYQDLNRSDYSTGDWLKDYYVTQTVLYCLLDDYGYDGHPLNSLEAVEGYQDVYDCVQVMYADVKNHAKENPDGYGDVPVYQIIAPEMTEMKLNEEGTYYQTDWYSVKTQGTLVSEEVRVSGAVEGAEIVYEQPETAGGRFYVRFPAEKVDSQQEREEIFRIYGSAKFSRPVAYIYEAQIADAQNISFLETVVPETALESEAAASLRIEGKVEEPTEPTEPTGPEQPTGPEAEGPTQIESAQTSDTAFVTGWVVLAVLAFSVLVILVVRYCWLKNRE